MRLGPRPFVGASALAPCFQHGSVPSLSVHVAFSSASRARALSTSPALPFPSHIPLQHLLSRPLTTSTACRTRRQSRLQQQRPRTKQPATRRTQMLQVRGMRAGHNGGPDAGQLRYCASLRRCLTLVCPLPLFSCRRYRVATPCSRLLTSRRPRADDDHCHCQGGPRIGRWTKWVVAASMPGKRQAVRLTIATLTLPPSLPPQP